MSMSKRIPFNIKYRPQIESGEYKGETRSGKTVKIIYWNRVGMQLVALVGEDEDILTYNQNGTTGQQMPLYSDLFIVTMEEELTPFEKELVEILKCLSGRPSEQTYEDYAKEQTTQLLALAREQFIKEGYVIEKKAFHDAVEKIDDKHKAEMSIEYSLHCKIENRTRHAVMNWQEFQELAQKFINIGKDEALKDLPRWRRYSDSNNRGYGIHAGLLLNGDWLIELKDLEKLPKEDEK